jgi:parallel beta-helix repeat protein
MEYFAIEDCEAFGSTIEHGIYVANSGDDNVIRGNRVHDNAGNGIHINGDPEMGGDGVISRALVENNRIWENGKKGGSALSIMHVQDSLFRNNLMYNNYAAGIVLFWYAGKEDEQSSKNNRVYNNTVFFRPGEGRSCLLLRKTATGNNVRNNLFVGGKRGVVYVEPSCMSGMRCDYNLVANYEGQRLFGDAEEEPTAELVKEFAKQGMTIGTSGGVTIPTSDWKMRGLDVNSCLDRMPEFVDAGKGDFRLAKGSAGIGAGTPISDVPTDIEGTPRPKMGPVDCGCYQTKAAE